VPKPLQIMHDTATPPPVPQAALTSPVQIISRPMKRLAEEKREPLQVRWPKEDVKAVKLAAIQADSTVSDFMLACFHAYMNSGEHE